MTDRLALGAVGPDRDRCPVDGRRPVRRRRIARGLGLARIALLASLTAAAGVPAVAQGLSELEPLALSEGANVQLADEDLALEQHRLEITQALQGGRAVAGAGFADTREPVTDDVVRNYRRGSVQVGARWPLLDGAQLQERNRSEAEAAVEVARQRRRQAETDALAQLRLAYVDHLRARERQSLARAFLALEPQAQGLMAGRTRASLLLDADRQAFQSAFETARRDDARQEAAAQDALRRARRVTGRSLEAMAVEAPRWSLRCAGAAALEAQTDQRPEVAARLAVLAAREALVGQQRWAGIDAGVSINQSLSRDLGASSGRSTGVSVDVSVPFALRDLRRAREGEARSLARRARLELASAREGDASLVAQGLDEQRVREADRLAYAQRLDAAREAVRVATLRAQRLDGDVLERLLQSRYALYGAAVDVSDALQRLERAQAQLLALAGGRCDGPGEPLEPTAWADVAPTLAAPLGDGPLAHGRTEAARLTWFVWRAGPWLAAPAERAAALPPATGRVLLGLDAAQLKHLATPAGAQAWAALRDALRARGVALELLLGEPGWVRPAGREQLVAMLAPLGALPVEAINLDLERSQLPGVDTATWRRGVLDTMRAVRRVGGWRVALTTHDRELREPRFNADLAAAGVEELVPMIYVSDTGRAAERARRVLRAADPDQRVTVAQSVEADLPAASSVHGLGRARALAAWDRLGASLQDASGFAGVAVQSFEWYEESSP